MRVVKHCGGAGGDLAAWNRKRLATVPAAGVRWTAGIGNDLQPGDRLTVIMRLLIACPKCGRQYDATGKRPGSRFRCHCGEVVTIAAPKGHDAKVVRCSACGAPQEEGSTHCRFCGADFTLHDRDLDTVCPHCMARISDRDKFCHFCGARIAPESVVGE